MDHSIASSLLSIFTIFVILMIVILTLMVRALHVIGRVLGSVIVTVTPKRFK